MARYSLLTATKKIRRLKKTPRSLKEQMRSLKKDNRRLQKKTYRLDITTAEQSKSINRLRRKLRAAIKELRNDDDELEGDLDALQKARRADYAALDGRLDRDFADVEDRHQEDLADIRVRVNQRLDEMEEAYQQDLAALEARLTQRCNAGVAGRLADGPGHSNDHEQIQTQLAGLDRRLNQHDRLFRDRLGPIKQLEFKFGFLWDRQTGHRDKAKREWERLRQRIAVLEGTDTRPPAPQTDHATSSAADAALPSNVEDGCSHAPEPAPKSLGESRRVRCLT